MKQTLRKIARVAGLSLVVFLAPYLAFVHHTDRHQAALMFDHFSGELSLDSVPGFTFSSPWVQVSRLDTRPKRVCITTTARAFNCKLVQFQPKYYREFAATQGFYYYWWANRISFNFGYDTYRGLRDILRGYAFGESQYPFISILEKYEGQK